jgi:hypothetical protein
MTLEVFEIALEDQMGHVSDLPVEGMEHLVEAQEPRLERLQKVEDRLADKLPEDDSRFLAVCRSIEPHRLAKAQTGTLDYSTFRCR